MSIELSMMQAQEKFIADLPEGEREGYLRAMLLEESSKVDDEELARLKAKSMRKMLADLPEEERRRIISRADEHQRKWLENEVCSQLAGHQSTIAASL